jgi:hypothetical protein
MSIKDFAEEYIKAYCDAFVTGNCDALERLEDPKIVHHSVRRGQDGVVGWEAHKSAILGMRQAIPGILPELRYLTGEGSLFAVSYKARGKFTGRAPGWSTPTGEQVVLDYFYLCREDGGRVAEAWYSGTATGLSQT